MTKSPGPRRTARRGSPARFVFSLPLVCTLLGLLLTADANAAQAVPHVIVETDMGGDSDDAAMVAFANRLADEGVIQLVAVMHNGNNEWGGAAISAINTYYGRPELPIGTYRTAAEAGRPYYHPLSDPAVASSPRIPLSYVGTTLEGHWVRLLAENFPCRYATRLDFPDAVDVYRDVLAAAPVDSVVIVNGGFLGNLSNVIASFDVDANLRTMFQAKVNRKTGAVGGVNTCDAVFPPGMAGHVLNNPVYSTATASWFGQPLLGPAAFGTDQEFADRMAIDNPVREAYRYKTEVEHGRRGTPLAWDWHIIDVITGFSMIAWNDFTDSAGVPYFALSQGQWLDVANNCGGSIQGGAPQAPHWQFVPAGPNVAPGESTTQSSVRIRQRVLDQGLYVDPAQGWSPEREHLAITATFDDGTFGGFDLNGHHPNTRLENGRLVIPSAPVIQGTTTLSTEGRRYRDQTFVAWIGRVPQVLNFPVNQTTAPQFEVHFWADDRTRFGWSQSPMLRIIAWPGRGLPDAAGNLRVGANAYRAELWSPSPTGYQRIGFKVLQQTAVGDPFVVRLQVLGNLVQAVINGENVLAAPTPIAAQPPADGGMTLLHFSGLCPSSERFEVEYAMLRPDGGYETIPDVYIDKAGTVWFSYIKNGSSFIGDLFQSEGGFSSHFVEFELQARPSWPQSALGRFAWSHPIPGVPDWLDIVRTTTLEGVHLDHWIYGIRGFPWLVGDAITLEYRGRREGEQVPMVF